MPPSSGGKGGEMTCCSALLSKSRRPIGSRKSADLRLRCNELAGFARRASPPVVQGQISGPANEWLCKSVRRLERWHSSRRNCHDGARPEERATSPGSNPRTITVDGVGDENAGAHDAEECGDYFQHGVDP